jgi:hypothetical protein
MSKSISQGLGASMDETPVDLAVTARLRKRPLTKMGAARSGPEELLEKLQYSAQEITAARVSLVDMRKVAEYLPHFSTSLNEKGERE